MTWNQRWIRKQEHYERTRGRKWMRLRHVVLVEEPVCKICDRKPSVEVDHIVPVSKGGTDERSNLQGACSECHENKTRDDLGIKAKPRVIGMDGYPIKEVADAEDQTYVRKPNTREGLLVSPG